MIASSVDEHWCSGVGGMPDGFGDVGVAEGVGAGGVDQVDAVVG